MSGSVDLTIETGADWGTQFTWRAADGTPYPFTNPVMNFRQDLSTQGKLIARLDESNQFEGLLTITQPGIVQARMTSEQTDSLQTGYGFWDLYVTLWDNRVRLVFGTVSIAAHVTELIH